MKDLRKLGYQPNRIYYACRHYYQYTAPIRKKLIKLIKHNACPECTKLFPEWANHLRRIYDNRTTT